MNIVQAYEWGKSQEGVRAARLFMDRPRILENRLTLVFARMDRLREKIAPVMYAEAIRAGTSSGDRTGQLASRLCDLEYEAEKLLHELTIVRKLRMEILASLPDTEAGQAVNLIYLEQFTQLAASRRMYMDERQFARRLRQGMELVATHLKMREEEYLETYLRRMEESAKGD